MKTEETFRQEYENHLTDIYLETLNRRMAESNIKPKPLPDSYDWVTLELWGKENFGHDAWALMVISSSTARSVEEGKLRSEYFKIKKEPKPIRNIGPSDIPEELIEYVCNEAVETDNGGIDWEGTFEACVYDDGQDAERFCTWSIESNDTVWKIGEKNDYKGPLDYGSKTLRKIQKLVREERA